MTALSFTVLGHPEPAGSKRGIPIRKAGALTGAVAVVDANPKTKGWQATVRDAALEAIAEEMPRLEDGPLTLSVIFYLRRPQGHYGSGRNAGILKESAPRWPTTKPDTTKLLRGVEDALTGILWRDDAQVVAQLAQKRYAAYDEPERAVISVVPAADSFARGQE